jgi:hypothetical protein
MPRNTCSSTRPVPSTWKTTADTAVGAMMQASEGMTLPFNDVDADGAVSLAEFLGQAPAWIAAMDRDGDGVITTADFGPTRG